MKQVKVEVLDAIVDGKRKGEQLEVTAAAAEYLAGIGYVKILEEAAEPEKPAKKAAAPKKAAAKK